MRRILIDHSVNAFGRYWRLLIWDFWAFVLPSTWQKPDCWVCWIGPVWMETGVEHD